MFLIGALPSMRQCWHSDDRTFKSRKLEGVFNGLLGSSTARNIYDGVFQRTAFVARLLYSVLVAIWRKYFQNSDNWAAHCRHTLLP